jgi:hypothetical protein
MHRRHVDRAHTLGGAAGLASLKPVLLDRIADTRTIHHGLIHLLRYGGEAPGVNGRRLREMYNSDLWCLSRVLHDGLLDGSYFPGRRRKVKIPKHGKPGQFRELSIGNIEDRAVARAVLEVLGPIAEKVASPFSFGFRPNLDRRHALANAIALASVEDRWLWMKADVEKAFDRVPLEGLLTAWKMLVPDEVIELLRRIVSLGTKRGIPQGSPVSPLLFNHFADLVLNGPWVQLFPSHPLIRYADDLLVIWQTRAGAEAGHLELARLAKSAGIPLKAAGGNAIADLRAGESLTWLGYHLQFADEHLSVRIGEPAWQRLHEHLAEAHEERCAPLRATAVVEGWLGQLGPCWPFEDPSAVLERVRTVAASLAFAELPPEWHLREVWRREYGRWQCIEQREAQLLPGRLARLQDPTTRGSSSVRDTVSTGCAPAGDAADEASAID